METILRIPASEYDHHRGTIDSPISIVQYGDYQCPYSAHLAPDLDRLFEEYTGIICHTYRHFPQVGIHEFSEISALAAEAAAKQDMFWQMHQLLYANSENLSFEMMRLLARSLRLDMNDFEMDMKSFDFFEKIKNDYRGGVESGLVTTPTLFINSVLYEGSSSYLPLKEAIEIAIGNYRSAWF